MIFHTYGNKENKAIILIHGVLTPWQIWNTAAEKFRKDYYVIVPELDAHTEDTPTVFHSVEEEAQRIIEYINSELNGHVFLLAGLSMGGRIAATVAKNNDMIPYYVKIAENMMMVSVDNIINSVFSPFEFVRYPDDMKILYMHGTRSNEVVSRKCALKMKKVNPGTKIKCFEGLAHAELACFKPDLWIREVEEFIS
ncbi:MAG: alpha/beta hydrolase [Clostridiales bacterium]|nr:alpha/beta hydrolase [Clostridiales bacterium]